MSPNAPSCLLLRCENAAKIGSIYGCTGFDRTCTTVAGCWFKGRSSTESCRSRVCLPAASVTEKRASFLLFLIPTIFVQFPWTVASISHNARAALVKSPRRFIPVGKSLIGQRSTSRCAGIHPCRMRFIALVALANSRRKPRAGQDRNQGQRAEAGFSGETAIARLSQPRRQPEKTRSGRSSLRCSTRVRWISSLRAKRELQ